MNGCVMRAIGGAAIPFYGLPCARPKDRGQKTFACPTRSPSELHSQHSQRPRGGRSGPFGADGSGLREAVLELRSHGGAAALIVTAGDEPSAGEQIEGARNRGDILAD